MKVNFSPDEMVYNSILSGKRFYDNDDNLLTIDYVKLEKETRQMIIHCTNGDVMTSSQDGLITWEVQSERKPKKPNKKRLRGKTNYN